MSFALRIGLSYLFAKKRANLWAIGFIAVVGVANGVGALLIALGITSGFMDTFRDKVLGVNGHVLVLKYGLDFHEYDDVIETAKKDPRVSDASPFLLNEMMLAKGTRLSGVLVKGIDPERSLRVLDLSDNLVEGTVDGLRLPDAAPARGRTALGSGQGSLDDFLADLAAEEDAQQKEAGAESGDGDDPLPKDAEELDDWIERAAGGEPLVDPDELDDKGARDAEAPDHTPLPAVAVPSPAEMSAFLQGEGQGGLPDEDMERQIFAEEALGAEEPDRVLPGIVLGRSLADNLDIVVGDTVRLVSPVTGLDTSLWEATPTVPRSRDYRVTGIFQAGFHEYDSRLVYIDLYEAQRFYNHGDTASGVEARLHDVDEARLVAQDLEASLGTGPFHTMSWQELNENLFRALEIQKYTVSLVIATVTVVAAFNVIATLLMIVLEKKREIAILKAMGARARSIITIFFVQGAVIGLVGTILGLLLGGGVALFLSHLQFPLDPKVYLIDHLPVRVSGMEFLVTAATAILISITATLIPSWWASRLPPAEGVRHE